MVLPLRMIPVTPVITVQLANVALAKLGVTASLDSKAARPTAFGAPHKAVVATPSTAPLLTVRCSSKEMAHRGRPASTPRVGGGSKAVSIPPKKWAAFAQAIARCGFAEAASWGVQPLALARASASARLTVASSVTALLAATKAIASAWAVRSIASAWLVNGRQSRGFAPMALSVNRLHRVSAPISSVAALARRALRAALPMARAWKFARTARGPPSPLACWGAVFRLPLKRNARQSAHRVSMLVHSMAQPPSWCAVKRACGASPANVKPARAAGSAGQERSGVSRASAPK